MKKIIFMAIISLVLFEVPLAVAEENNLISRMQTTLKSTETPKRFVVSFDLLEPIDLSQGKSNIILEYFTTDGNGNLVEIYRKDKSWSGYLNSYDNYPAGEQKYSSGAENAAYSNVVKAATIYSSTKTGSKIDVESITAVRITVLRAVGSGEKVTIYNNGTISPIEKITVPVLDVNPGTGIILQSTTAQIPTDTVLVSEKITIGSVYEAVSEALENARDFIVYNVKLESKGLMIQPDGKVQISIPVPEEFSISNVTVYHIDNGIKTAYPITITEREGATYATFETEHFSIYALTELQETVEYMDELMIENEAGEGNPKTGESKAVHIVLIILLMSIIGIIILRKKLGLQKC